MSLNILIFLAHFLLVVMLRFIFLSLFNFFVLYSMLYKILCQCF